MGWGQGDLNPHSTCVPTDFKSGASTDSAMPPSPDILDLGHLSLHLGLSGPLKPTPSGDAVRTAGLRGGAWHLPGRCSSSALRLDQSALVPHEQVRTFRGLRTRVPVLSGNDRVCSLHQPPLERSGRGLS